MVSSVLQLHLILINIHRLKFESRFACHLMPSKNVFGKQLSARGKFFSKAADLIIKIRVMGILVRLLRHL